MKLEEIFDKYSDHSFKFIPLHGNYGDYLIYAGAEKLANEIGIKHEIVSHKTKVDSDDIIYIHGSGGYNSNWGLALNMLKLVRKRNPENLIIVGPSTASLELNYLKLMLPKDGENIIFFARERTTYEFMKKNFYTNTYLDEDAALHLSHYDKFFNAFREEKFEQKYKLLALRTDKTRSNVPREIDIKEYDVVCDPCKMRSMSEWLNLHLKASKITTNRSHSAILGVILGKKVELFANSYHKNRSIWEYSLKDRGVAWIGPKVSNRSVDEKKGLQWHRTVVRNILYRCFLHLFSFPFSIPKSWLIKISDEVVRYL